VPPTNVVPLDRASLTGMDSKVKNKAFHLALQEASDMLGGGSSKRKRAAAAPPKVEPFGEYDLGFCQECSGSSKAGVIIVCDGE
jgi:hypothetical protein